MGDTQDAGREEAAAFLGAPADLPALGALPPKVFRNNALALRVNTDGVQPGF